MGICFGYWQGFPWEPTTRWHVRWPLIEVIWHVSLAAAGLEVSSAHWVPMLNLWLRCSDLITERVELLNVGSSETWRENGVSRHWTRIYSAATSTHSICSPANRNIHTSTTNHCLDLTYRLIFSVGSKIPIRSCLRDLSGYQNHAPHR